eukprot:TRINITY_DN27448_c0_g1_i1.p6 TRINITY_DN27448_c0_g1~~TRINITY_DN27448_c0_g1_i1.p6  ORF type:complete len:109 (-),score=0.17 TRINITY_DN27448_c0_g1_i1:454-780(-)
MGAGPAAKSARSAAPCRAMATRKASSSTKPSAMNNTCHHSMPLSSSTAAIPLRTPVCPRRLRRGCGRPRHGRKGVRQDRRAVVHAPYATVAHDVSNASTSRRDRPCPR